MPSPFVCYVHLNCDKYMHGVTAFLSIHVSHVILSSLTGWNYPGKVILHVAAGAQILNPVCEWPVWDALNHTSHFSSHC